VPLADIQHTARPTDVQCDRGRLDLTDTEQSLFCRRPPEFDRDPHAPLAAGGESMCNFCDRRDIPGPEASSDAGSRKAV
jgi:hypothetical protein